MAVNPLARTDFDGEPVLYRASLSEKWNNWRLCDTFCKWTSIGLSFGFPFLGCAYCLCSSDARRAEMSSFSLVLTPSALHFSMKMYSCLCCCQSTVKKSIPLDRIQDIVLVSDFLGDCCDFASPGKPWQMHVQTAGSGGPEAGAELTVVCVEDLDGLRSQILAAKRTLLAQTGVPVAGSHAVGASKDVAIGVPSASVTDERVLATLERIERAIHEGVAAMHRRA